jgi:hypothetical protein
MNAVIDAFNSASEGTLTATEASTFGDRRFGGRTVRLRISGHRSSGESFEFTSLPISSGSDLASCARSMAATIMAAVAVNQAVAVPPMPTPNPVSEVLPPVPVHPTAVVTRVTTVSLTPIRSFPEFAQNLHAQLMSRIAASQQRLVEAQARVASGADKIDAVAEVYEKTADEIDQFTGQLGGNMGPTFENGSG